MLRVSKIMLAFIAVCLAASCEAGGQTEIQSASERLARASLPIIDRCNRKSDLRGYKLLDANAFSIFPDAFPDSGIYVKEIEPNRWSIGVRGLKDPLRPLRYCTSNIHAYDGSLLHGKPTPKINYWRNSASKSEQNQYAFNVEACENGPSRERLTVPFYDVSGLSRVPVAIEGGGGSCEQIVRNSILVFQVNTNGKDMTISKIGRYYFVDGEPVGKR